MPRLWPFEPTGPVRETLEWRTDLQRTYSGETRHSVRWIPRQTVSMTFEPGPEAFSAIKTVLRAGLNAGDTWWCPLWFAAHQTPALSAGTTVIDVGPWVDCYGEFLLVAPSTVLQVASKLGSTVTLAAPLATAMPASSVVPLIEGVMAVDPSFSRTGPRAQTVAVSFITDRPAITPADPYPDFLGSGLVVDRRCLPISLDAAIYRPNIATGSETGLIERVWSRAASEHYQGLFLRGANASDTQATRRWLAHIRGRCRSFWAPEWHGDVVPTAPLGTNTITARKLGDRLGLLNRRILIRKHDGAEAVRRINTIADGPTAWTLTLDAAIGFAATPAEIDLITVVSRFRSDTDSVELTHLAGGQVEAVLPMVEVGQ